MNRAGSPALVACLTLAACGAADPERVQRMVAALDAWKEEVDAVKP